MFTPKSNDELQMLLEPIRKKLGWRTWVQQLSAYSLWGVGGSVLLLLVARFWPIPYYSWIAMVMILMAALAGALSVLGKKPTPLDSARVADANGLAQRVVTAWENRGNNSMIAGMQREDALRHLRRTLPQAVESVYVWKDAQKQLVATGGLLALVVMLMLWPNPQDLRLAQMAEEKRALAEVAKELETAKEEAKTNAAMSEAQKKQLELMLEQAKKALANAKDPAERLNALRAAEKQLEKWKEIEQKKQAALQQLQKNLGSQQATRALADAMKSGQQKELEAALREAAKQLEKMSQSERDAIAKELEKAAEQLRKEAQNASSKELEQIANQMAQAAQQLAQGQVPQAMTALDASLMQALAGAQQSGQAMLAAASAAASLQQSQMTLASAGSASAGATGTATGTAGMGQAVPASGNPAGTPGGNGTNPPSSGTTANGNPGTGTANQPGNGNGGSGQGNGSGSGSGNGSGNGSGSGSGSGSGKGSGAGLGTGSHELVTVPSARIGGENGPTDTVGGPLGAGPSESRQSGNTQVSTGGTLPYEEVYGQYEQFARESMEKGNIPGDYQEVVKQYFSNIEP
ncbi:hypothetical protein [Brevibacillus choshinensis]|uniref:hypothetical protein n=1 Tax=Brevibacillus choshinensis TaxID=54911 RepID=UPI002E209BBA|nr:hypothetical protein [Brevibacillus choshinensis]